MPFDRPKIPAPEVLTPRRASDGREGEALRATYGTESPDEQLRLEERDACLRSTFYFAATVMRYRDLDPDLHGFMAAWIQRPSRRKLGLAPRGHLKSSIWTVSDALRRATADPNTRILLINATLDNALKWIHEMQQVILSPLYAWLFPDAVPDLRKARWNQNQIELRRTENFREATVEATGVGVSQASKHFRHIKEDDLVSEQMANSPTEIEKAITQHKLAESLLVAPMEDSIDTLGTRWAPNDLVRWMLDSEDGLDYVKLSCRKPDGTPIWPDRFSDDYLVGLRKKYGPALFSLNYENEAIASGITEFDTAELRWWHYDDKGDIVLERPMGEGGPRTVPWDSTNRFQVIDAGLTPDSKDARTANVVAALCPPEHENEENFDIVIVEAKATKSNPDQVVEEAWESYRRYDPMSAAIEVFGGHVLYFHMIQQRYPTMRIRKLPQDTKKSKQTRIREFYTFCTQNRVYLNRSLVDWLEEYAAFSTGRYVDLLDATAWLPRIWVPPTGVLTEEEQLDRYVRDKYGRSLDEIEAERAEDTKDEITGY